MKHVVAVSGGKDSTAMALRLRELNPNIDYLFVCTPTGNELPEMWAHWRKLGDLLGKPLIPIIGGTLQELIEEQQMIPNHRARFCTRLLKIQPYAAWLMELSKEEDVISYVGIRADEYEREAGDYTNVPGVSMVFPMREWRWTLSDVLEYLREKKIDIPKRTDCALCYHQRIGEWWDLWREYPEEFEKGIEIEQKYGHTFRSEERDSWPASLAQMAERFKQGDRPKHAGQQDMFSTMKCRVCRM